MRVLVVNAGSSSLKLSVLDGEDRVWSAELVSAGSRVDDAALSGAIGGHGPMDAVGHRIVHGGTELVDPVVLDPGLRARLEALTDLAPLHQPKSLAALDAVTALLPDVPAVACFDTAFHATIPPAASTYALPPEWRQRWGLRRFGFHGLSHSYASRRVATLAGVATGALRTVTCHLGAGASLAAVRGGVSIDTTMGFTPLEGLVMATRSGTVDPGLILWLEEHTGMPAAELAEALEHRSGLLGLTGHADMREVLEAEGRGDPAAALGVEVFLHRLRREISAMAAAMDGLDAIAFTGGIGEGSAVIRARVSEGLGFLGIELDPAANDAGAADREIGARGAGARSFVVEAREDLEIARGVGWALGG